MSKKLSTDILKLSNILNSKGIFAKIDPNYCEIKCRETICLYLESKSFNLRSDKGLKLYIHGTLTYEEKKLIKYGTKMVLTQKNINHDNEEVIHSMHFDGDINESKKDHPIFHMQFDKTLIRDMTVKDENYFKESPWPESRQIRIPTPQMDVFTVLYFYLKTMNNKELEKLPTKYLADIKDKFNISCIKSGFEEGFSNLIFPN